MAPPAYRERTATIQLPPLNPSEPVRTQVIQAGRPLGRCQAAACGPRVEGPDPADTPTNGGSREAAPPGNLAGRMASGQRSTDSIVAGRQMAPGLRSPPTESTAGRTPRGLTLRLTIGSHGRGPEGTLLTPSAESGRTRGRSGETAAGGWQSPCLVRGRQRGPNNPRHSETAVQAGKNVLGRAALLHATRPHKDPPAALGRSSCVQTFPVPDPIRGGVFLYGGGPADRVGPHKVGLSLSPSNHAGISL